MQSNTESRYKNVSYIFGVGFFIYYFGHFGP